MKITVWISIFALVAIFVIEWDPAANLARRGVHRMASDPAGAAADFEAYLDHVKTPKNNIPYRRLAIAYQAAGEHEKALRAIDDGLRSFPASINNRHLRLELLEALGRTDEAAIERSEITEATRERDLRYLEMYRTMKQNNSDNDSARDYASRKVAEYEEKLGIATPNPLE